MKDIDGLCMNCFSPLTNGNVCEECGYDNDTVADMMYLQPKTVLAQRYVIGTVISHESDAVLYKAYDARLDEVVEVREFLPKGIANRLEGNLDVHIRERYRANYEKYKRSFINLWTTIVKMSNLSAVIPVYEVFEENGTAYAVSEHLESITLREFLLRSNDGYIMWEQARLMFMPVLTTLEALHSNSIIHGAICPDNLVLCRDGKVRLKSFCISEANTFNSDLQFNENDGYTAIEQYENSHKMCPATDIYAFSACIFRALVGQNPPDSRSREARDKLMIPNAIAEKIPTHIIKALGGGLQIYPEKRTQTIEAFRELLNAAPAVVAAAGIQPDAPETDPVEEEEHYRGYPGYDDVPPEKPKGVKVAIGILVVLIIAALAVGIYFIQHGKINPQQTEPSETVTKATHTVPDFASAGYTQSDVQNNGAWNKQFKISYVSDYSKDVEEGIIFKQSIEPGKTVDEGSEILLTVSKGVKTQQVPDVGGLTLEEAKRELEKLGFKVSSVEIYNEGGFQPNTVRENYGITPAPNEQVAVGEEIILQVYGEVHEPATSANTDNQ